MRQIFLGGWHGRWFAQQSLHWTAAEVQSLAFFCSVVQKHVFKILKISTVNSWAIWMLGVENPPIILQLTLCIHHSASEDTTNCRPCSNVVCIYRNRSTYKWSWQFKLVLFKGQLSMWVACWLCPQPLHLCCCEGRHVDYGICSSSLSSIYFSTKELYSLKVDMYVS